MESVSIVNNSRGIDGTNDGIRTGAANVTLPVTTIPIDQEYFRTLEAPLVAGRAFNDRDTLNSAPVAIINQELAKLLVRTEKLENPIGRRITSGNGTSLEIVGIARNVAHRTGFRDVITVLYRPLDQTQRATVDTVTVMTRFSGTAGAVRRIMHEKVSELDSSLFVYSPMTLDDQQGRILLPLRIIEYLIGIPGIFALLLGIVGTYGTMATLVAQRRREVGIRIALGAHPSTAVRGILQEGLRSVTIGAGFGIAAVVIIVLWLSRNIGEVEFYDPIAFVAMTLLVVAIAGAACYIPAKRASRLDPMIVLRED